MSDGTMAVGSGGAEPEHKARPLPPSPILEFESFPDSDLVDADEDDTFSGKIRRFFSSASSLSIGSSAVASSLPPSSSAHFSTASSAAPPSVASSSLTTTNTNADQHRTSPGEPSGHARQQSTLSLASIATATNDTPRSTRVTPSYAHDPPPHSPATVASSPRPQTPDFPTMANGRRTVRSQGMAPSVRVTVTNSELGDFVQSGSRSVASDYHRMLGNSVSSSNGNEGLAYSSWTKIPGFPLGRDGNDDSRSVRSMSTANRPQTPSAAQVFRRLRGEGLSKEYWIRDESAKECFDCQTVFSAWRRKHHCRICGQIFCSRCASNIISSERFGAQGSVRVCNLCLSIMEESGDPANDHPPSRFRPGLRHSATLSISAPLEASARPPQSQFAASQLFPHSESAYGFPNPAALARDKLALVVNGRNEGRRVGRGTLEAGSRPETPFDWGGEDGTYSAMSLNGGRTLDELRCDSEGRPLLLHRQVSSPQIMAAVQTSVAPFRRGLAEDDKVPETPVDGLGLDLGITTSPEADDDADESSLGVDESRRYRTSGKGGEGSHSATLRRETEGDERERGPPSVAPSLAEFLAASRPTSPTSHQPPMPPLTPSTGAAVGPDNVPSPSSLHSSVSSSQLPPPPPSPPASIMRDVQSVSRTGLPRPTVEHIRQMVRQGLQRAKVANESAWEDQLLKLLLTVAKVVSPNLLAGDQLDIRSYVRIKRIPGGRPKDSEYVDGVVFTKNLVHKQMSRLLSSPRIMLLSFGLEYQRVENQLVSIEPVINQEREYLRNLITRIVAQRPHIVLVEKNVARLAIEFLHEANIAVARNVKPKVIAAVARSTSADIISSIDKLVLEPRLGRCATARIQTFSHSLIPGGRKTFIRFEGCNPDLGCTLVLRGGSMDVLAKVKKILEFMVAIVYSAKLEGHLLRDELVVSTFTNEKLVRSPPADFTDIPEGVLGSVTALNRQRVSRDISSALVPYESTLLAASPWVKFQPPYPLLRMREEDLKLNALRRVREDEEAQQILHDETIASNETLASSASSASVSSLASAGSVLSERAPTSSLENICRILKSPEDLAKVSEYRQAEAGHAEHMARWKKYLAESGGTREPDPQDHQKIHVLESVACMQTDRLCMLPTMNTIIFYGENDMSLGQYIDRACREAGRVCVSPSCQRPRVVHYTTWVHGGVRVSIIPEAHSVEKKETDFGDAIIMYSWCKVCRVGSTQLAMSDETFCLSFGKYLQLCFYSSGLACADGSCQHNGHLDQVRFFTLRNITLRIVTEVIDVRDVVLPPMTLKVKPENQLQLRNEEFRDVLNRGVAFFESVRRRIGLFNFELISSDKLEEAKVAMGELASKCEVDRKAMLRLLQQSYEELQATKHTEMTTVRRALQNQAVEWESEFSAFENRLIPPEKDVRRLTTLQLKRLFSDPSPTSPERRGLASSSLAPSFELDENQDFAFFSRGRSETSSIASSETSLSIAEEVTNHPSFVVDPPFEPPSLPFAALASPLPSPSLSSTSSTSTASLTLLSPRIATPKPHEFLHSSDNDSDSTICADERRPAAPRISSPFLTVGLDEMTSGADSDIDFTPSRKHPAKGVADLVSFFSEANAQKSSPVAVRPGMRRGATDRPRVKSRPPRVDDVFSDGDASYARHVAASQLASRPLFAERPSRIPAPKHVALSEQRSAADSATTIEPGVFASRISTSPTSTRSSSRPASRPGSGRTTPALSRQNSHDGGSASTIRMRAPLSAQGSLRTLKGKSKAPQEDDEAAAKAASRLNKAKLAKETGLGRPTTSSANKATRRLQFGGGPGQRVTTIANHFNRLSREAERERQRKLALFRQRRARPVAAAHSSVQIFDNVKDAAKEDSEDDDEGRCSSDDGADDEYDDEVDQPDNDEPRKCPVGACRSSVTESSSPVPPSAASSPEATACVSEQISISEVLVHQPGTMPLEVSASVPRCAARELSPSARTEITDAGTTSVPPSPRMEGQAWSRLSEAESSGSERNSILKSISNLWSYRGGDFTPLEYPLLSTEHIFIDNPVLVREDEPSSIIAFALSSKAYHDKLKENTPARGLDSIETFAAEAPQDVVNDGASVMEPAGKPESTHMRLQFEDATTTFSAHIFFANEFHEIRRSCGIDDHFVESLARCVKWSASGGKSNAAFLKSKDERYIIKEISAKPERESLFKIAPAYFEYMAKVFEGRPSALAKMFGFYRIGLKNSTTGKSIRLNVVVMENLFYERRPSPTFDLKGSTRNRHIQVSSDKPNEVLLDQNLVELSFKTPLYIRESSKRDIKLAIHNDSLFLASLNVMDYSLVLGVDHSKGELIVGIVDYVRQFTWDKQLESWVKRAGGPSEPTIVTPKTYKARFREAMHSYFLLAPDPWLCSTSLQPVCAPSTVPGAAPVESYAKHIRAPLQTTLCGSIPA